MRPLILLACAAFFSACTSDPEESAWRLCGEGEEPAGLREALTRTSAPHLRRIGIGGGLGNNAISHPGIAAAAVAEALAYACDDLPPALRHAASAWSIELRTIGRDDVVIIAINTMER